VKYTNNEDKFVEILKKPGSCDEAWIISGSGSMGNRYTGGNLKINVTEAEFVKACVEFNKKGGGLCIFADNDPFFYHSNIVLKALSSIVLVGNTPGSHTLKAGSGDKTGQFGKHLITAGIANLFEGITICYPQKTTGMQVLATSGDGNPVILCREFEKDAGRIVVDCAFTKLYCNWDSAGTARYVRNLAIWLLGIDYRKQKNKPLSGPI